MARPIELDIGPAYALFTRYLHPLEGHQGRNLFDAKARTEFAGDAAMPDAVTKIDDLRTAGLVVDDTDGTTLAPMRGRLVLPDSAPDGGTPVVLIVHGMAPVFEPKGAAAANEVLSYQGYAYFQRHLAGLGIASLSLNANVVNKFASPGSDDDHERRAQLLILHLGLLKALADGTAPQTTPLRCKLPKGLVPLGDALAQPAGQPSGGPDTLLRELSTKVKAAKLDLTRLGLMGHSRGAPTVAVFADIVAGTPPSGANIPAVVTDQRANVAKLVKDLGAPAAKDIKAVLPLEPDDPGPYPLKLPDIFLLAVAGSHDEDVSSSAANIYEGATCAKAMLVMHGATHGRFNTVWRELRHTKMTINESIKCQSPISIMSNASHEALLTAFGGNCFAARLLGQDDKLLIFTGEQRGPQGTDVTRAWRFPVPVNDATGVVTLDAGVKEFRTPIGASTATAPPFVLLSDQAIGNYRPFAQDVKVFRIARPASKSAELLVPIAADQLANATHLSCRLAKEFDAQNPRTRATEPLRNFSFGLFAENGLQIGATIPGSAVASIVHDVYPVRKWTDQDGPPQCYDDTHVFLQTVEVPVSQFLKGTRFTASDLGRVRELRFGMLPATKSGDDIYRVVDFLLTKRQFAPTSP
jgi:hypothetical protein